VRASAPPDLVITATRPHLAQSLVSSTDFDQLDWIGRRLPACALSVGYECRLSPVGAVDLGISVSPVDGGAQVLAGVTGDPRLARAAASDDRWRRLRHFARIWTEPGSNLLVRIPFIFLEFDAGGSENDLPIPSVFLGLDWPTAELGSEGAHRARSGLNAVLAAAETLRSEPIPAGTLARLRECFAALPVGGVLLHAGVMLSRPGQNLRLSAIVPRGGIVTYLEAVGRTACAAAVSSTIERYAPLTSFAHPGSHVQLDFDAGGADTRVGLTLCPPGQDLWPLLLALLCADGLCDRDKGRALLQWPGQSVERLEPDLPPCRLLRRIEHVKLVFAPELVGAKAYFGATPYWTES
jgi:hypothetical protein